MNAKNQSILIVVTALAVFSASATADPLPGQVLKFQQLPLDNLPLGGAIWNGHDERSIGLATLDPTGAVLNWTGGYMADDFSDTVSRPVVHVTWWGSYIGGAAPSNPAQQFLIAFETDVPAQNGVASHPGTPLLSQIVTAGTLSPGSGTFTETLVNGNVPEHLYKYNAELSVPFPEQANTIYWLKIVALTADPTLAWGWHDRDFTVQDTLASPAVLPGEANIGPSGPLNPQPVWHFQDAAVAGGLIVTPISTGGLNLQQPGFAPQSYIDNVDGPIGIGAYPKDLAFALYTTNIPEPATLSVIALGALAALRRRRNG